MKKKHIFYGIAQAVPSKIELSFQQDVLEKVVDYCKGFAIVFF